MEIDAKKLLTILPHRYPFLLVDRVIEVEPGKKIVARKNVTFNELEGTPGNSTSGSPCVMRFRVTASGSA